MAAPHWAHTRLVAGPWLASAVLLPVVLAVGASLSGRGGTEGSLTTRTTAALEAVGITDAEVTYDGVVGHVVLKVRALPDGTSSREVQDIVDRVRGARSVSVSIPRRERPAKAPAAPSSPTPSDTAPDECVEPQSGVDALLGPDLVAFGNFGAVLPEDERGEVEQVAALLVRCGVTVDVFGHTADRAPSGSTVGVDRARAVAAVLTAAAADVRTTRGRRSDDPLGDNTTQAGRLLNRYARIVAR